jgi:hypothetical protein
MRREFDINFVDKHLLINDGENTILVDTGSPVTIHTDRTLRFNGEAYTTTTDAMGNTIEKLQAMSGVQFTTLMGLDILSQYKVVFDYPNSKITFCTRDEQDFEGEEHSFKCLMGTIVLPITLGDRSENMILDTGATLSYVDSAITRGMTPETTVTDFSPLVGGQFTTPVFELESNFCDRPFHCKYGNLPLIVENMIGIIGVRGVVGYDLLKSFKMMIDIRSGQLVLLDR